MPLFDELQTDLDSWMKLYNEDRPHQGRWCYGKTPMQIASTAFPWLKKNCGVEWRHQP